MVAAARMASDIQPSGLQLLQPLVLLRLLAIVVVSAFRILKGADDVGVAPSLCARPRRGRRHRCSRCEQLDQSGNSAMLKKV